MSDPVVTVQDLSRRYDRLTALDAVSIDVQGGYVYGLVGANGAGKTTLIKHLLGLLRAQQGIVRVFGLDPVAHPVAVLQRIGYLSEERELPEWMRIEQLLRYTAAFYPRWDTSYANELLASFQLDVAKKVKHLSKGMRAQTGLIAAVAHRPDLLILDEPSTGLDPIVRKDILNAIIRTVAGDGRTALFSSHLLDEIELMSDFVIMFAQGKSVLQGRLCDIKDGHQWVTLRSASSGHLTAVHVACDSDRAGPRQCSQRDAAEQPGRILYREQKGDVACVLCCGSSDAVVAALTAAGAEIHCVRNATLQEIFAARAGRHTSTASAEDP